MPNQVSSVSFAAPSDYTVEAQDIERRRRMAEAMRAQGQTPLPGTEVIGGWAIPRSPMEGLAKALQSGAGAYQERQLSERQKALAEAMRTDRQRTVEEAMGAMQGSPAIPNAPDELGGGPGRDAMPADPRRAYSILAGSQFPELQQIGLQGALKPPDKPVVVGRSLINPTTGQVVGTDATWQEEQKAAREAKQAELQIKLADAQASRQEREAARRELLQMQIEARRDMVGLTASLRPPPPPEPLQAVIGDDGKPVLMNKRDAVGRTPYSPRADQANAAKLPASALRMQQEELDAINTSGAINADLQAFRDQIKDGKLQFGPIRNLQSKAQNIAGMSDTKSQNFAAFQSTLERLRNESLRLNKGVQTEGDSQRAWNELVANINDQAVVDRQLKRIQEINERAINQRRMNVDVIRSNFGVPSMDVTGNANQQPAIAAPPASPGLSAAEKKELEELRARFKK